MLDWVGLGFNILYSVEMVIKIAVFGLKGKDGYFNSLYHVLDTVVVVSSWFSYIPGLPSLVVLRTFRALKPLRSLNKSSHTRQLVSGLLMSLRQCTIHPKHTCKHAPFPTYLQ